MPITKRLTIFEGPDCAGKTTAAQRFAYQTGAAYAKHGPYLGETTLKTVAHYVESMIPALRGERDVVLDRCWLSETPYAEAHRDGATRFDVVDVRMLERLALSCGSVVILCQPSWEICRSTFERRSDEEYLNHVDQLRHVYERYASLKTALPAALYDYTQGPLFEADDLDGLRSRPHSLAAIDHPVESIDPRRSAGDRDAPILLVGEQFTHKWAPHDLRWPFASWSGGCSQWLTNLLETHEIHENSLCWANADTPTLKDLVPARELVVALGVVASKRLQELGVDHQLVPHPQYWKRFRCGQGGEEYPLVRVLKEVL